MDTFEFVVLEGLEGNTKIFREFLSPFTQLQHVNQRLDKYVLHSSQTKRSLLTSLYSKSQLKLAHKPEKKNLSPNSSYFE